jgi:hypothetical protein
MNLLSKHQHFVHTFLLEVLRERVLGSIEHIGIKHVGVEIDVANGRLLVHASVQRTILLQRVLGKLGLIVLSAFLSLLFLLKVDDLLLKFSLQLRSFEKQGLVIKSDRDCLRLLWLLALKPFEGGLPLAKLELQVPCHF